MKVGDYVKLINEWKMPESYGNSFILKAIKTTDGGINPKITAHITITYKDNPKITIEVDIEKIVLDVKTIRLLKLKKIFKK